MISKDKQDYLDQWKHGGMKRSSVNILRLLSELEGSYQLTKYMAFDDDMNILNEMKERYYKLYFKLNKEEKQRDQPSFKQTPNTG
jgi:hypothetical protein|tara:strand:- start:860 stop:1114 length:255 start_codon:yes stop_codon:yes gene_type:complete